MTVSTRMIVGVEEPLASLRKRWRKKHGGRRRMMKKRGKQRKKNTEEWLSAVIHAPSVCLSHGHHIQ